MWRSRASLGWRLGMATVASGSCMALCDSKLHSASVVSRDNVASTRWLALQTLTYKDQAGKLRKWDVCQRTTRGDSAKLAGVDAVVILALLKTAASDVVETLLVQQYRPPVNAVTIELPAGLIDAGGTAEQAAVRELKEETGFVGTVVSCSSATCMSPGLTDESVKLVVVDVDLDAPANANPTQALEETEYIQVSRVPVASLASEIKKLEAEGSMAMEGLFLLALGLEMGAAFKPPHPPAWAPPLPK